MGKIKELFLDIKDEIQSSAEERVTVAKIEKRRRTEDADYADTKRMQHTYLVQEASVIAMNVLSVILGTFVGSYILKYVHKYDVFKINSFFNNISSNHGIIVLCSMGILQLIANMLPFFLSIGLFEIIGAALHVLLWRLKNKIYAPIFVRTLTKEKMDERNIRDFLSFENTYMAPKFTYLYLNTHERDDESTYHFSDKQVDELERKCKAIFPKPESNVPDYIAFALNKYRKPKENDQQNTARVSESTK